MPVVVWTQKQHVNCSVDQLHRCGKAFQTFGETLRNEFGDNTNKWRLFLGLAGACVDPTITFQHVIGTAHQLDR